MTKKGHGRSIKNAILCALLLLPASAVREANAAPAAEPQRLSARGKSELLGIIAAGRLETLQWPEFGDYQAELGEFYRAGDYALAWVRGSRPTVKARAIIKLLRTADEKGLLPQDYDGSRWKARLIQLDQPFRRANESRLVRFDAALTICAMRYILDLHLGRINPRPFRAAIDGEPDIRGPSDFLLKRVVPAQDVPAAFSAVEPPFPPYRRLIGALQRYKELSGLDDGGRLPASKRPIRPGANYPGVPRLARLLRLLGDLPGPAGPAPGLYTGELVGAVKRFQRRHGLAPDGIIGAQTLNQLNTPLSRRLDQLRLNLERWRWLPRNFSRPPIIVNIPEFRLYAGDGKPQKVMVGMAFEHQTPVFASLLTAVTFRPPWNIPLSIQQKEMVKEIEKDASYLEKHDMEAVDGADTVVSSGPVTTEVLGRLREGLLSLRQRPGPGNSLGLVKFVMPNAYDVYLHGTPAKQGFWEPRRDLSHGCIRIEDPARLAAWLLRGQAGWTPKRILATMAGKETVTVKIAEPVPVLIQYGTAVADEDGEVRFFDDIYGRDAAEEAAFEKRSRAGLAAQ